MPKIEVLNVIYDGYERLYTIKIDEGLNKIIWAHGIAHGDYIECGSRQSKPPKKADVIFSIEWVLEVSQVDEEVLPIFIQDINGSSHVRCIGTVSKLIDQYSFWCTIPTLGEVVIELERGNTDICVNMNVEFTGNLKMELLIL